MKEIVAILLFTSMFVLLSCEDTTEPVNNDKDSTLTQDYFIYYPMSQNLGWRPEHSGLFRSNFLSSETFDRVITSSIIHTSKIGKNGTIAYLVDDPYPEIWIRYKDGTTQVVPFPGQTDNGWQIELDKTPGIELSYNGNLLVYFVTSYKIDGTAPDKATQLMVTVDLTTMTLTQYDIRQFYFESLQEYGFECAQPYGKNVLVNEDGSKIYFVLKGMDYNNGSFSDIGYSIIKFENGIFSKYGNVNALQLELNGFDLKSNKIYCKVNNEQKYISEDGTFTNCSFLNDAINTYHQFDLYNSKVVIGDDSGISIYDSKTETKISTVITWDSLMKSYPLMTYKTTEFLSLSPDAGLITFALHPKNDTQSFTLFAIRKDGSGLKRIVHEVPIGMPVISYGFKK